MPNEKVVVNASPLICFFRVELEDLLSEIFGEVYVPESVWQEILNGPRNDRALKLLESCPWIRRIKIEKIHPKISGWDLGAGESEVLSYALLHQNVKVVIDDSAARRCARTYGIPSFGSGGILIIAKRRGFISSVSDVLNNLRSSGLWLSEDIVNLLKTKAGESPK